VACEIEAESGNKSEIDADLPEAVGVCHDGSLNNTGIEIQTPPATGDKAEYYIKRSCEVLRSRDYDISDRCGLHIHLDARDIQSDCKTLDKLFRTYYLVEPILLSILPKSRYDNTYCHVLSDQFTLDSFTGFKNIEDMEKRWYNTIDTGNHKSNKYDSSRYHGFNMHSIFYRGSLEIRYHSGTINPNKIINWIYINLKVMEWALKHFNQSKLTRINDLTAKNRIPSLCKLVGISEDVKNYMVERFNYFNREVL
jgi:hypothetical protein